MKSIGIQRIEARLREFEHLIDMSDCVRRPEPDKRQQFLSRALAAYCVKVMSGIDFATAARSVTDSFHDRGVDAVYYDPRASRLLIVQAKWSDKLAWNACGEFVDGVRKIVAADWTLFSNNKRIYERKAEIQVALENAENVTLVTVHHGPKPADPAVLKRIDDLASEIDGGSGIAKAIHWHQADLLDAIKADSDPPKVNVDLYLCDWGEITEPYRAVYGRIQAQALVDLWKRNSQLCHVNLREYARRTDVNAAIAQTVTTEPNHFWYFNNGLTIICDSYTPGIAGRLNKELSPFHFEGINLVNGAQTAGIVSDYLGELPKAEQEKVWIQNSSYRTKVVSRWI